jgi:hypothetical protein
MIVILSHVTMRSFLRLERVRRTKSVFPGNLHALPRMGEQRLEVSVPAVSAVPLTCLPSSTRLNPLLQ